MPRKKKTKPLFKNFNRIMISACVILVLGFGFVQLRHYLTRSDYFQIKSVIVDPSLAFIRKSDLMLLKNKNIFEVDISALEKSLSYKYPQITELKVARSFPNQIQLLARKRNPFVQTKIGNRVVTLDEAGVILSTTNGRDKKLPIVSGLGEIHQKLYLGSTLRDDQLEAALAVLKAKKNNLDLSTIGVEEVHVGNLSKIDVMLANQLLVILDQDHIGQKIRNLSLVLNQTHIEMEDIKYIDLRFKDPIIGKK